MCRLIFAIVLCVICVVMMFMCLVNIDKLLRPRLGGTHRYSHTMISAIGGMLMGIMVGVLMVAIFFVIEW